MANYIVQDTSLETVADSIRAKAGISEKLEFPLGWKAAVDGITGGGDGAPVVVDIAPINIGADVTVVLPSGVEYYYNTELLPEIPDEIIEGHKHVLIAKTPTATRIYADTNKPYYSTAESGNGRVILPDGAYIRATLNTDANAWVKDWSAASSWLGVDGAEENFAIWWSNFDVPKGSQDATEIYFPACEPKTEQPAATTRFYFNGVNLPKLPEDVLTEYPYAFITKNESAGYYDLILSTLPPYYNASYNTVYFGTGGNTDKAWYRIEISAAENASEWTYYKNITANWGLLDGARVVLWTSHNMPTDSATSSTIYRYGTVAVPVPTE